MLGVNTLSSTRERVLVRDHGCKTTGGDSNSQRQKRQALEGFLLLLTVSLGRLENQASQKE